MGDSPGGERVAEAMGMDARDAGSPAEASQQLFEPVRPETHAGVEARVAGREEEGARGRSPVGAIGSEGVGTAGGEGDDPGLVTLAVAHVETAAREVAIREVQSDRFGTADAGVQQRVDCTDGFGWDVGRPPRHAPVNAGDLRACIS